MEMMMPSQLLARAVRVASIKVMSMKMLYKQQQ
jgi:hypothetical protein